MTAAQDHQRPFTARQLLEFDACTRCGECLRACESFAAKGDEGAALMGMISGRRRLFRRQNPWLGKLLHRDGTPAERWRRFQEGVFSCPWCGRCQEFCPVGIRTRDLALAMRQELAAGHCMMPKNLEVARDAVLQEGNVFRFPNEDRAMWAEFLDDLPCDVTSKERAEVLYFVGCVSSFSPAVQEIPQAFLRVLLKAGVDVALLAGKEWCCGFPLIVGGWAPTPRASSSTTSRRCAAWERRPSSSIAPLAITPGAGTIHWTMSARCIQPSS